MARLYFVPRLCADGCCPASDGACDCLDPTSRVDVRDLSPDDIDVFSRRGSPEQRDDIAAWLGRDEGQLLAGQSDRAPLVRWQ